MATKEKSIKVPITITLAESAYKKILDQVEGEGEDAQKFSLYAQEAFDGISKGAILLGSDVAQRLLDIDESLADPDELIEAVERGMGVHEGAVVGRWTIDPTLVQPLTERAETQSTTVDQMIQDMMDQAVAMGWYWDLDTKLRTMFFSHEDYARLCEALGEPVVTGELLMSRIISPEATPPPLPLSESGQSEQTEDELALMGE